MDDLDGVEHGWKLADGIILDFKVKACEGISDGWLNRFGGGLGRGNNGDDFIKDGIQYPLILVNQSGEDAEGFGEEETQSHMKLTKEETTSQGQIGLGL